MANEKIMDYLENALNNEYIDADMKVMLENHIPRLAKLARENVVSVSPAEAYQYDYNYYGLLRKKNIDYRIHWLTMRCNGRMDPNASCIDVREIAIPPMGEVERILSYWRTTKNKGLL